MITRATIDRIREFRSDEFPVLSVYVDLPPNPADRNGIPARLKDLLRPIEERAKDAAAPREGRESLKADLEHAAGLAERLRHFEARAAAFFTCAAAGWAELLPLPVSVRDLAVVDDRPYLRPLLRILDEHHRFLVAVVDRRHASLYELYMDAIRELETIAGEEIRKKNFAGWYGLEEHRVRNRADEKARAHFRSVAIRLRERFEALHCEHVIVGGQTEIVDAFLPYLGSELRSRVAGRFVIDTHTLSPARVREACRAVERALEEREERDLVARIAAARAAGGLAALGLAAVLPAVSAGAVDVLAIHDAFAAPGVACSGCDWLGLSGSACPWCGSATRAVPDVVETAADMVLRDGGRVEHVEHVPDAVQLREHGVGALLRFQPTAGAAP